MRLVLAVTTFLLSVAPVLQADGIREDHVVSHADLHGGSLILPLGMGKLVFENFVVFPDPVLQLRITLAEGNEPVGEGNLQYSCLFGQSMEFYFKRECHAWVRSHVGFVRLYVRWSSAGFQTDRPDDTRIIFQIYGAPPLCQKKAPLNIECDLGTAPLRYGPMWFDGDDGGWLFVDDVDFGSNTMLVRYAPWSIPSIQERQMVYRGKPTKIRSGNREVTVSWSGGRLIGKKYHFSNVILKAETRTIDHE